MLDSYLDSVDLAQIARFNNCLPIRGVTTNPSILAAAGVGLPQVLPALTKILGDTTCVHVQVVSQSVDDMLAEAKHIAALPYNLVIKVPATETGLAAIRKMKAENLTVLATAIYSAHQGFLAALSGADYLAPYVNRIDTMGGDGIKVVADLQLLLDRQGLNSKVLPASFKNTQQVVEVLKSGVAALTLPVDVAAQMFAHPAVQPAVDKFTLDWQGAFGSKLAYE